VQTRGKQHLHVCNRGEEAVLAGCDPAELEALGNVRNLFVTSCCSHKEKVYVRYGER